MSTAPRPTSHPPARRGLLRRLGSIRWALVRLAIAAAILGVLVEDNLGRLARLQLAALPDFDYAGEVRALRAEGRYAEALLVAETGLEELSGEARAALARERETTRAERDSLWRKIGQFARGAALGQGTSIEELVGAVSADMLVVGDVRDLVLQGARLAVDGETDELVVALSALGVATTVAPEIDWGASLLKIARKAGALTKKMTEAVLQLVRRAARGGDRAALSKLGGDLLAISQRAGPAGAIRLLRFADDPKDLAFMADFLRRERVGAFALHVGAEEGVAFLKRAGQAGDAALVAATKKGSRGLGFLRSGNARFLRPHPLLGLVKAGTKGTAQALAARVIQQYLDPYGLCAIALFSLWTMLEAGIIYRRLRGAPAGTT